MDETTRGIDVGAFVSRCAALGALALLAGCGGGGSSGAGPVPTPQPTIRPSSHVPAHVVVVVQENRTIDNLFHTLPGVDTVDSGVNSHNQQVPLQETGLVTSYDPHHTHQAFVLEYNGGTMNGFDREGANCQISGPDGTSGDCVTHRNVYTYVRASEIANYLQLAENFGLADHVFETNQGPSYPAHFYLVAAQSGDPMAAAENASNFNGGCDAPPHTTLRYVDLDRPFPGLPEDKEEGACVDFPTIFDELNAAHVSWKYYAPRQDSLWNSPNGIKHLYDAPEFKTKVVYPESAILNDIALKQLPAVSYVVPNAQYSDHALLSGSRGPDWVGTITNAVGNSAYWNDTVIFVVWDDWGGWYDHYTPHAPLGLPNDPYEFGMRVPLLVISPYVRRRGLIDHTQRDFTSILKFIEFDFHVHALTRLDAAADDLTGMFDFKAPQPLGYVPVDTHGFVPFGYHRRTAAR